MLNGAIFNDKGEVVRIITIKDILDFFTIDFAKVCGKPGDYTFRVDNDDFTTDYEFWIKPEGNGLREIPLGLF